jgi:uncharacterized protein Smg (DUF494 family)
MSSEQPLAKRQKTYEADGPVEDDKTAREKLQAAGFDPDDVHTAVSWLTCDLLGDEPNVTPMVYFSCKGDLPMCRYLFHVRGAVTTTAADEHLSEPDLARAGFRYHPIYDAALFENIETVKWLFRHGAKREVFVRSQHANGNVTAITRLFCCQPTALDVFPNRLVDLAMWFVMEGLLEDDGVHTDRNLFCHFVSEILDANEDWTILEDVHYFLFCWLEELIAPNVALHTFLLGTARTSVDTDRPASNNACFAPYDGVLEKIGDFVGIIKNKTKVERIMSALNLAKTVTVDELEEHRRSFVF